MRYRRRRAAPIPYWIAGCEFEPQGLLEVWISRRGRPALVCDECGLVWFDPEDLAVESAYLTPAGTAPLADGDTLDPPHARLASRADLEALGGWRLVPSASRAQHGEQG
jgi:hypothetical protein